MDLDDDIPGKKPPASSVSSRQPMTLLLRKTRDQVRIEGGNPDLGWAETDDAIVDPDIAKRVGRIYQEVIRGEPKWM